MRLVRRKFLKLGVLSSVFAGASAKAFTEKEKLNRFWPFDEPSTYHKRSILQGATDETQTQFSVLHPKEENLTIYVETSNGRVILPDRIEEIGYGEHPMMLSKVYVSELNCEENYLIVLENDLGQKVEEREFKTLPLGKRNLKFALASCMDDENHRPEIWEDMVSHNPDIIFYLGDSVYADRLRDSPVRRPADPDQLWMRFCEARLTLEIYQSKKLIPILAAWDDHDLGENNSGKDFYYLKESQKNFLSFFAQEESHCTILSQGPGVGCAFRFNNQLFLLLDGRSFRKNKNSTGRFDHWGEEQEKWALNLIDQHHGCVWFMTGSQIFPSAIFKESVSKHHPKHLRGFVDELVKRKAKVAFVSGDVHYSEISEIESAIMGYKTFEFTSSSIHSSTFPGLNEIVPNKRRIVSTGKRNFLMIDSEFQENQMKLQVTSHSPKGRTNFKRELTI